MNLTSIVLTTGGGSRLARFYEEITGLQGSGVDCPTKLPSREESRK